MKRLAQVLIRGFDDGWSLGSSTLCSVPADLTAQQRHTRSYTVTGWRNFTGRYLFTTPCSDLP